MALSLREALTHPVTAATTVVGVVGGWLGIPLLAGLWAAMWATAGKAFAFVSLLAFTAAPRVSFLPETPLVVLALALGGIVVVKRGRTWLRSFIATFRSET
jgi:uncharacterized membrane protein YkgB